MRGGDDTEFTLILAAILTAACALLMSGCMDTSPAARSNRAQYGDMTVRIEGRGNTVNFTIGDGLFASADAKDTSESTTATPTMSIPTSVTVPAAATPLTAGIQAAGEVAKEGIKAASKESAANNSGGAGCPDGQFATPGGAK